MPKSSWAPPKAMRGKCERGHGSVNADGGSVNAGAEVQTQTGRVRKPSRAMGTRRGRLSAPWPRFHGVDRADVYIIIHVRACCCGECALNPPTSQPIPRRRPSLAPAQRHALPEHFRSPTQPRRTPSGCAMHSPPTSPPIPRRRPSLAPHSDTPSPSTSAPHAARRTPAGCAMHSPPKTFARPEHFLTPFPSTSARPRSPDARPPTAQPIPAEDLRSPTHSDTPFPSTSAPPRNPDARPQATRCTPRQPHNPFPAAPRYLPFRSALGTKKRHRTVHVRCRMSRSTVVAVGHWGW